jgi:hypothetical protein
MLHDICKLGPCVLCAPAGQSACTCISRNLGSEACIFMYTVIVVALAHLALLSDLTVARILVSQ